MAAYVIDTFANDHRVRTISEALLSPQSRYQSRYLEAHVIPYLFVKIDHASRMQTDVLAVSITRILKGYHSS